MSTRYAYLDMKNLPPGTLIRAGTTIRDSRVSVKNTTVPPFLRENNENIHLTPAALMRSKAKEFVNLAKMEDPAAFG